MKTNRVEDRGGHRACSELNADYERLSKVRKRMAADDHLHDELLRLMPENRVVLAGACERMAAARELSTQMEIVRAMEARIIAGRHKIERRG